MSEIEEFDARINHIEDILASASLGDFSEIRIEHEDQFSSIEMGLNMLLSDLQDQIRKNNELIERQRETIQTLSTPVISIMVAVAVY